jgi:rhamnose utilization protein RhaD (predicted bifunctional aldolase and dehydrogenase)
MNEQIAALLELSRELGREERRLAILAEGNTSARLSTKQFAVKASGASLATLSEAEVTVCDIEKVLALMEKKVLPDTKVEQALLDARVESDARRPSIEAMFHAWLLSLEGVAYVGHCHPVTANQVLCSPRARDFAERRMFPDEVVCCGAASVYVPYADPGLILAREIRDRTTTFMHEHGYVPRLIVLQNHGLIGLGATPAGVLACLLMADKAAAIFAGAAAMGGPTFLTPPQVERIRARPDEAYRQRQLKS